MLLQKQGSGEVPVFGIVVRKKVGSAVIRNKLKRRIRAYLRENEEIIPINMSGIIIAQDNAGEITWQETAADLAECISRTGI